MGDVAELAERAWSGDLGDIKMLPGQVRLGLEEFASGLAFMSAFSNVTAIETGEGLVLVDTSGPFHAAQVHESIRAWSIRCCPTLGSIMETRVA